MRFKHRSHSELGLGTVTLVPLIDVIFIVLFFFMLSSYFTVQPGISVKLPRTMTSDILKTDDCIITITNENIIYLNNKIISISKLKSQLNSSEYKKRPVLIQADRRASVGRIVDIWDMCRSLGIEQINIATNQKR